MTTGRPPSVPRSRRPTWPGAVAAGQPGSSSNGTATGSSSSSARPPSPEPRTIPTSGRGTTAREPPARARRGAQGGRTEGWAGTGRSCANRHGCGPPELRPGVDGRWPATSAGPTDVPTPGCRSRPAEPLGDGAGTPSRPSTEAPEATGPGSKNLDVISVLRSLAAPSGKTYLTNPSHCRSTTLSTSCNRSSGWLSTSYAPLWTNRGQPHRTALLPSAAEREHLDLGQRSVAAARSSE